MQHIQSVEEKIRSVKDKIIVLKNDVLYGYEDRYKAMSLFEIYKKSLIEYSEQLNNLFQQYFQKMETESHHVKILSLEKEYMENLISYKQRLKTAEKTPFKQRKKIIKEAVKLNLHIEFLASQIRELKYGVKLCDKDGMIFRDIEKKNE